MNRKKKLNNRLKSKVKKANAKLRSNNKPKYISKAARQQESEYHSECPGTDPAVKMAI